MSQAKKVASMGPRLFSRGMRSLLERVALDFLGFNGAAAVQPRNVAHHPGRVFAVNGFNGAAAVQPRNAAALQLEAAPVVHASMGPRLFSRGMHPRPLPPDRGLGCASMGPRLFSRGMLTAWRKAGQYRWASMGPRLFSRGMAGVDCRPGCDPRASMGPRLFSRGMDGRCDRGPFAARASMGPRLFSRGMTDTYCSGRAQCRGFNGAAAVQPRNGRASQPAVCKHVAKHFSSGSSLRWGSARIASSLSS